MCKFNRTLLLTPSVTDLFRTLLFKLLRLSPTEFTPKTSASSYVFIHIRVPVTQRIIRLRLYAI